MKNFETRYAHSSWAAGFRPATQGQLGQPRRWLLQILTSVLLLLFVTPSAQSESVVVEAAPGPFTHVTQNARITVLFDGKPVEGAKVVVWK